jgi:prolyl-tRNA editing enzyme YbaK/EbsC (Cys-tRNA(Pro) deacylase)
MSLIKVKEYLRKYNMAERIIELNESSATVEMAANALGCEPKEIAKTLGFITDEDVILIVAAGDARIDNQKFKECFNTKANMIPFEKVEELVGHEVGGVCPFGINENVKVYLDISLKRFNYVYPACGSTNSAIKLSLEELEECSNYLKWVDVCKNWE